MSSVASIIGICLDPSGSISQDVSELSASLSLPIVDALPKYLKAGQFVLLINTQGLSLQRTGKGAPGPVYVDFIQGASAHRRHFGGGKSQLIAKAVGIKGSFRPHIFDLTAGLGQDGFVLATLGCRVDMVERVPIIFHLLNDGLQRAQHCDDDQLKAIVSHMTLHKQQSFDYLNQVSGMPDVIYFDPMFPEKEKSAKVKKNMAAFQSLVGGDSDAGEVLSLALAKAKYRVVVKRPRKAPTLCEQYPQSNIPLPGLVMEGKSSRYDIYPIARMPI